MTLEGSYVNTAAKDYPTTLATPNRLWLWLDGNLHLKRECHKINDRPEAKITELIINKIIQSNSSIFPIFEFFLQMNAETQYIGRIKIAYLGMLFA
jgi:hypothetical protein